MSCRRPPIRATTRRVATGPVNGAWKNELQDAARAAHPDSPALPAHLSRPDGAHQLQVAPQIRVRTRFAPQPIPSREYDWIAVADNFEPGHPLGHGATQFDALCSLFHEIAERRA